MATTYSDLTMKLKSENEVIQLHLTLCGPMDCSLPGFSIHGIFLARILEWVAISFSRRSSWPRDWTRVPRIVGRRFTVWATREALMKISCKEKKEERGRSFLLVMRTLRIYSLNRLPVYHTMVLTTVIMLCTSLVLILYWKFVPFDHLPPTLHPW